MNDSGRLNGIVKAWERGVPASACFSPTDKSRAAEMGDAAYHGVVFDMEHNPYDVAGLGDALQYMLNRKRIARAGSIAPAVTPLARIAANGSEMNQYQAKQVLDSGVYGVVFPHVETVEHAYHAVASCRYAMPAGAPLYEPRGIRGDAPMAAARYWGLDLQDYYRRADVWPLVPHGEILVGLMIESPKAIENLNEILREVPGVGFCLIGEGDLSQALGCPGQYHHPEVVSAINKFVETCKRNKVPAGHPHVDQHNVMRLLEEGFNFLMTEPMRDYSVVEEINKADGSQ